MSNRVSRRGDVLEFFDASHLEGGCGLNPLTVAWFVALIEYAAYRKRFTVQRN
jgi:hypothetical protein